MNKNTVLIVVLALVIVGAGGYFVFDMVRKDADLNRQLELATTTSQNQNNVPPAGNATNTPEENNPDSATTTAASDNKTETVIGKSVDGRNIVAYHFGNGDKEILLVGGIHGGYAWNTALLGYQLMDYFKVNPNTIPGNIKVTVVPVLNPDGFAKVVSVAGPFGPSDVASSQDLKVAGRFNANNVDLNRNFDCGWKASGVWQSKTVSGGASAFSEPESAAIRDYAQARKLTAVVAWYSAGGGVYSSSCGNGIIADTQAITDIYAKASGYTAYKNFASYQVSGDMTDWFAKNNIPAIGVLLTTASGTEMTKNQAGVKAIFQHYSE